MADDGQGAVRDDLTSVHIQLTGQVLLSTSPEDSVPARIAAWEDDDQVVVTRAVQTLEEICADDSADLARILSGSAWSVVCWKSDSTFSRGGPARRRR